MDGPPIEYAGLTEESDGAPSREILYLVGRAPAWWRGVWPGRLDDGLRTWNELAPVVFEGGGCLGHALPHMLRLVCDEGYVALQLFDTICQLLVRDWKRLRLGLGLRGGWLWRRMSGIEMAPEGVLNYIAYALTVRFGVGA